jgi:competence/damage-inducible protein CinA-like protein
MPTAEILTIGTEILLGEIQDTNTAYLARILKDLGIDLFRTQTVGDNPSRIASILRDILTRADFVITTGGLGPTVDDPTRQAVADAFQLPLVFREDCWQDIQAYFQRIGRSIPHNNKRQAYLPENAIPIHNPVGTAPGFILDQAGKVVISLPGVPKEMEHLIQATVIPFIQNRWQIHHVIRTRVIHVAGIGEAHLDDLIGEFEKTSNPTVGLLAKTGVVDIRIGAKAETIDQADQMISGYIQKLQAILGDHIVSYDQESLLDVVSNLAHKSQKPMLIHISGFQGRLDEMLLPRLPEWVKLTSEPDSQSQPSHEAIISLTGKFDHHPAELSLKVVADSGGQEIIRKYAGPPENSVVWGINTSLDFIRRYLLGIQIN